jgi:hypothetical protein
MMSNSRVRELNLIFDKMEDHNIEVDKIYSIPMYNLFINHNPGCIVFNHNNESINFVQEPSTVEEILNTEFSFFMKENYNYINNYLTKEELNNLGCYYLYFNKSILAKLFLKFSIDKGNNKAMRNLGHYYEKKINRQENGKMAKKYFRKAGNNGNIGAFFDLGNYFQKVDHNSTYAKLFYSLVIENKLKHLQNDIEYCKTLKEKTQCKQYKQLANKYYYL